MEKIALVTGASRGIGRAVAAELARRGWAVCIGYRVRQDKAEELAAELAAEGCRVMTYQADVSQREQVEAMVRWVEQTFGAVSLLVNNAGIAGQSLFQELTDERWHEFFSVNVDGAFYASRAVLPAMLHALAAELAPSHIRVNCVAPGVIQTDMLDELPPELLPQLAEQTPMGRLGTPADIAAAVAFLASPEADFITGQVLTCDGGFIL